MPIAPLDPTAQVQATPKITPKFFSSKLTGRGKNGGLISSRLVPDNKHFTTWQEREAMCNVEIKKTTHTADGRISAIPFAPTSHRALDRMLELDDVSMPVPDTADCFEVTCADQFDVYFSMTPQAMLLREPVGAKAADREVGIAYRMELWVLKPNHTSHSDHAQVTNERVNTLYDSVGFVDWSTSPLDDAGQFITTRLSDLNTKPTNLYELEDWLRAYPLYDRLVDLAEIWSSPAIANDTVDLIRVAAKHPDDKEALNQVAFQLRYLENYSVPLEAYRIISNEIAAAFNEQVTYALAQQNLNLLLEHTLSRLGDLKPQLPALGNQVAAYTPQVPLSAEQRAAVTATGPLNLTIAGAGTGKSTTINERIKFLFSCGVKPEDLTVLSFTNAAADHISEIAPGVGSMTIAQMIISIYSLAYPSHRVSSADTIGNSLRIFAPNDPVADRLSTLLVEMDEKKVGAMTKLNIFVQHNFSRVIELLDRIGQTTLELQIIICYQRIDQMSEPPEITSTHLIIDEVQDNSIFEFIFVLKYIAKHLQSLYIVGDASQTLYEFRFANPRALPALESSGVFDVHTLSINYRSDQEVLDYANTVLAGLDTNRNAGIQLRANSLATVTADTFRKRVRHSHLSLKRMDDLINGGEMEHVLYNVVDPIFTAPNLAAGEQTAFLAYSRKEATEIQRVLEKIYPGRSVVSLMSDISYDTDIFSRFIASYWRDVLQVPPQHAAWTVERQISAHFDQLVRKPSDAARRAVSALVSQWWEANAAIISAWVQAYNLGRLSRNRFFDQLRDSLLGFEISHNQAKRNLSRTKNAERKEANLAKNADLIVSTIHGVKGLEFPHVVVFAKEPKIPDQALQRLHYVAMTRATSSEFVVSYSTDPVSRYAETYANLVEELKQQDMQRRNAAAGVAPNAA